MRNKTVSVRLDSETLERLGAIANAMDRPMAWLMAHAIPARYVEEQSWQVVAVQKAMKRLQSGEAKFADHKQEKGGWKAGGRPVREIRRSALEVARRRCCIIV